MARRWPAGGQVAHRSRPQQRTERALGPEPGPGQDYYGVGSGLEPCDAISPRVTHIHTRTIRFPGEREGEDGTLPNPRGRPPSPSRPLQSSGREREVGDDTLLGLAAVSDLRAAADNITSGSPGAGRRDTTKPTAISTRI